MYSNLILEINANKINKAEIAAAIQKTSNLFSLKLSGKKSFTYEEAIIIQETFFPKHNLQYLFYKNGKKNPKYKI